jgi:hypothetical protein
MQEQNTLDLGFYCLLAVTFRPLMKILFEVLQRKKIVGERETK